MTTEYRLQQGAISLIFTLIMLMLASGITFSVARLHLTERQQFADLHQAVESSAALDAALEYGIGWLNHHRPDHTAWSAEDENGDGVFGNDLNAPSVLLTLNVEPFRLNAGFTRQCLLSDATGCRQWLVWLEAGAALSSGQYPERHQSIHLLEDVSHGDYVRVPGSWRDW